MRGGGERNVKILPRFCHGSRTGLVNCCQIKKTGRRGRKKNNKNSRIYIKKKNTFPGSQVRRVPPQTELHSYF